MSYENPKASFPNQLAVQLVLTPAIVATIVAAEQTFTCPGVPDPAVRPSIVTVNKPTINGAISICAARASAANQIGLTFINPTVGGVTPTAGETYQVNAMF